MSGPKVEVDLEWSGELCLAARVGAVSLTLDSDGAKGPSPVQALAAGLASCMAIDVVHILTKGRLPLRSLRAHLVGERAALEPKRLLSARLHFMLEGEIADERVERAIALSREKYCSVWHSLRQDIDFRTSFEVKP